MRLSVNVGVERWRLIGAAAIVMLASLYLGMNLGRGSILIPFGVVLAIAGAVGFRVLVQSPAVGLYLAVASMLLDSRSIPGPISLSLSNVFLLATLGAILLKAFYYRRQRGRVLFAPVDNVSLVAGGGLLLAAFLSLALAQFPATVVRLMITLFGSLLILVVTQWLVVDLLVLHRLMQAYLIGAVSCALIGIGQSVLAGFFGITLGTVYEYVGVITLTLPRVASTWLDPNVYGLYLSPAVPFVISSVRQRWLRVVLLSILAAGVAVSYSRTAWVSAACGVWLAWALLGHWRGARNDVTHLNVLRWIVILVLTAGLVFVIVRLGVWDNLVDLNRDAVEGRIDISLVGWRYFLSSPLIGVGVGNFVLLNEALTHNSYLSVLIEYGVVGASAWLGLLAWTAWRGLRLIAQSDAPEPRRLAIVCTSALAGLLIGGLAIEIESDKFVWLVIALLSSLAMRLPNHVPPVAMRVVSADR